MTIIGPIQNSATTTNASSINTLFQNALQIRRNSSISVFNSVFVGYPVGLFIDSTKGTATDTNITNGNLNFENNIIAACTTPLKYGASATATGYTLADLTTWFNAKGNTILSYSTDVKLAGAWNNVGSVPNFSPASGSPLLTGAAFTNTKLSSGFTAVTYRGAVKDANDYWYAGWTNWNL
jgi:hypothetical protein